LQAQTQNEKGESERRRTKEIKKLKIRTVRVMDDEPRKEKLKMRRVKEGG